MEFIVPVLVLILGAAFAYVYLTKHSALAAKYTAEARLALAQTKTEEHTLMVYVEQRASELERKARMEVARVQRAAVDAYKAMSNDVRAAEEAGKAEFKAVVAKVESAL